MEFNLSKKIDGISDNHKDWIKVEDVKEFIKKIKEVSLVHTDKTEEYLDGWAEGVRFMFKKINKLAGGELAGND